MPTVLRVKGYRFAFFAADSEEPVHVHVTHGSRGAKYWLQPFVRLAKNKRFRPHELTEIKQLLNQHRELLLETWDDYFGH